MCFCNLVGRSCVGPVSQLRQHSVARAQIQLKSRTCETQTSQLLDPLNCTARFFIVQNTFPPNHFPFFFEPNPLLTILPTPNLHSPLLLSQSNTHPRDFRAPLSPLLLFSLQGNNFIFSSLLSLPFSFFVLHPFFCLNCLICDVCKKFLRDEMNGYTYFCEKLEM